MNCTHCGRTLGQLYVEGGFCSQLCRARAEHEDRMRQKERMSIHLSEMDDGGFSVELKTRSNEEFAEMTKKYESFAEAVRGIATLCVTVADGLEAE